MLDTLRDLLGEISLAEWIAVAFALAYVVLAIRQHVACWAASIVSSAIFLGLFWRSGLVMQALLQVFYVGMALYGWWSWRHGEAGEGSALPVSRWPLRRHAVAIVAIVLVSGLNGRWIAGSEPAITPYVDALTTWASCFATWLVARKVLENWLYWIVIDLVAAALYFSQGLRATTVLFVVYAFMAVRGYLEWRRDLRGGARSEEGSVHA